MKIKRMSLFIEDEVMMMMMMMMMMAMAIVMEKMTMMKRTENKMGEQ